MPRKYHPYSTLPTSPYRHRLQEDDDQWLSTTRGFQSLLESFQRGKSLAVKPGPRKSAFITRKKLGTYVPVVLRVLANYKTGRFRCKYNHNWYFSFFFGSVSHLVTKTRISALLVKTSNHAVCEVLYSTDSGATCACIIRKWKKRTWSFRGR